MVEELTEDERHLIDVYRALNADGRQRVRDELYILSHVPKYQQQSDQSDKEIIGVDFATKALR